MTPQEQIEESLHRLEIYVSEHGQVFGTVSMQMARDAIKTLREELRESESVRAEVGASSRLEGICPGPDICQERISRLRGLIK